MKIGKTEKAVLRCGLIGFVVCLVAIAVAHWIEHAETLPMQIILPLASIALAVTQFFVVIGLAAAFKRGKIGGALTLGVLAVAIGFLEAGVLYEPFARITDSLLPRPAIVGNVAALTDERNRVRSLLERLQQAELDRDGPAAQQTLRLAARIADGGVLAEFDVSDLTDGRYGRETANAVSAASAALFDLETSLTAQVDESQASIDAHAQWAFIPIAALLLAAAFEMAARYGFAALLDDEDTVLHEYAPHHAININPETGEPWSFDDWLYGRVVAPPGFRIVPERPNAARPKGRVMFYPLKTELSPVETAAA